MPESRYEPNQRLGRLFLFGGVGANKLELAGKIVSVIGTEGVCQHQRFDPQACVHLTSHL